MGLDETEEALPFVAAKPLTLAIDIVFLGVVRKQNRMIRMLAVFRFAMVRLFRENSFL